MRTALHIALVVLCLGSFAARADRAVQDQALKIKKKLLSRSAHEGLLAHESFLGVEGKKKKDDKCDDQDCHDKRCKERDDPGSDDCRVSTSVCVKACKGDDTIHGQGKGRCLDNKDDGTGKSDIIFTFPGASYDNLSCNADHGRGCDVNNSGRDVEKRLMHCAHEYEVPCPNAECNKWPWSDEWKKCCLNGKFGQCKDCSD